MTDQSRTVQITHQDDEELWLCITSTVKDEALCDAQLMTAIMTLFGSELNLEANDGNPVFPIGGDDLDEELGSFAEEGFVIVFRRQVIEEDAHRLEAMLRSWLAERDISASITIDYTPIY